MKLNTAKRLAARINSDAFDNALELPRMHFTRSRTVFGYFDGDNIALNPRGVSATRISETVYHELVHCYIYQVLSLENHEKHDIIFWSVYFGFLPDYIASEFTGYEI